MTLIVSSTNTNTLDRLAVGQSGCIESVVARGDRGMRLMEMGLTPGTVVRVARVAPLGDPIDILVRGYHLSLRAAEAMEVILASKDTAASGR